MAVLLFLLWIIWNGKVNAEIPILEEFSAFFALYTGPYQRDL